MIGTSTTAAYPDTTVAANTAYLYVVRAVNGAGQSASSNAALATTTIFSDPNLTTPVAVHVKADHINQLRAAIGAVRTLAGSGLYSFTDPGTIPSNAMTIKRAHIVDLRTALDQARAALSLAPVQYVDPTITAGVTKIKAQHIYDLRNGTK